MVAGSGFRSINLCLGLSFGNIEELFPISFSDGAVIIDVKYLKHRKVFGQLIIHFRFGREKDEVMGLKFYKDFILASQQIYPPIHQITLTETLVNHS